MKIVSWNTAHRREAWQALLSSDYDIALLQEASAPPAKIAQEIEVDSIPWETAGAGTSRLWRTAVVNISKKISLQWFEPKPIEAAEYGGLAVSRMGTLAAASLEMPWGEELTVVSVYGAWERPYRDLATSWIYADASVHRLISDLSVFIGQQKGHRVLVAGDLNILYGYGDGGSPYWASRYNTVFDRMEALGLRFIGPQEPNGRPAEPWPAELPSESRNVPTFFHSQQNPFTASRQLDFVFASEGLSDRINVSALNHPDQWGPSDHCQIEIEINE